MSVTPRVSLVAWEDRQAGFIFVAVPDERGRYLRTDRSVVACGCPQCGALVGEPCKSKQGYGGGLFFALPTFSMNLDLAYSSEKNFRLHFTGGFSF